MSALVLLPSIATTPQVDALLAAHAPIAVGVSGGEDSAVLALGLWPELDRRGHAGPRLLVHADLGRVEWRSSLPHCELLAQHLGAELLVVRRARGGLLERWQQRWRDNLARYAELRCLQLILPWSSAGMRFCTSELKTQVIWRALAERWPGQTIINATGIRADESPKRALRPVAAPQGQVKGSQYGTAGLNWCPIKHWVQADVDLLHAVSGFPKHEAYTVYGSSRLSCAFCVLASLADLLAASTCPENQALYRELVELEIVSAFSFQPHRWLGDVAPHLLTAEQRLRLRAAQALAQQRQQIEARLPAHLRYHNGWPTVLPTRAEAQIIADVRQGVAALYGLVIGFIDAEAVIGRFAELMAERQTQQRRAA
ncbi:MAG TPA: phosphoadenosine phosphosulfate reductase family protein [Roseiflexaceae bacterium]|nr:phosphoadenosine phosphosulfate reductase family protein [Roseiflexaceae bacterium]